MAVRFDVGMTMNSVNASLINDDVVEGDEEFVLTLNVSLFDGRISPGDRNTTVGVITDTTSK